MKLNHLYWIINKDAEWLQNNPSNSFSLSVDHDINKIIQIIENDEKKLDKDWLKFLKHFYCKIFFKYSDNN